MFIPVYVVNGVFKISIKDKTNFSICFSFEDKGFSFLVILQFAFLKK